MMVEHFSKSIELIALSDKSSVITVYALLDIILNHLDAPVKVLTYKIWNFRASLMSSVTRP